MNLETDRLLLSLMFATDAEALFELLKEPALYIFTGDAPPASADRLKEQIRWWERRRSPAGDEVWLNWTIHLRNDQTVVGYFQTTVKGTQAELAWVIGLPFQGLGYATEAAHAVIGLLIEQFKVNVLRANIHSRHLASQAVARHIGLCASGIFTEEGEETWTSRF